MKIKEFKVKNFGSYPELFFTLDGAGLALIYGPTGAGKSTIMDAVCWCLYGQTAKGGTTDSVKSWFSDTLTEGEIVFEANNELYTINRTRGKASENDLIFNGVRGVNITETQSLIDQSIGADMDTFIASAYFNEFSPTSTFFTDKAKDRRDLFEKIANLTLPNKLAAVTSEKKKLIKNKVTQETLAYERLDSSVSTLKQQLVFINKRRDEWEQEYEKTTIQLQNQIDSFDSVKEQELNFIKGKIKGWEDTRDEQVGYIQKQIDEVTSHLDTTDFKASISLLRAERDLILKNDAKCPTCGDVDSTKIKPYDDAIQDLLSANSANLTRLEKLRGLNKEKALHQDKVNPLIAQYENKKKQDNPYYIRLEAHKLEENPFKIEIININNLILSKETELKETKTSLDALKSDLRAFDYLYDLAPTLRSTLLKQAIKSIEEDTNKYLDTYFDSELRVAFDAQNDNLGVSIFKSGYECEYKQLSKGQRQLLKLSFTLSIMAATASNTGVHFSNLFFDEALDGMDETLKIKAFSIFENLESIYDSVLVIDHAPALQNMFSKKYLVTMVGDKSSMVVDE